MRILIKETNLDRIAAELKKAEGRAQVRTCSASDVQRAAAHEIQAVKAYGASKKSMDGLRVKYMPGAENFPHAYKYVPLATSFTIEYGKGGQSYLIDIRREPCDGWRNRRRVINMPEGLKTAILAGYEKFY